MQNNKKPEMYCWLSKCFLLLSKFCKENTFLVFYVYYYSNKLHTGCVVKVPNRHLDSINQRWTCSLVEFRAEKILQSPVQTSLCLAERWVRELHQPCNHRAPREQISLCVQLEFNAVLCSGRDKNVIYYKYNEIHNSTETMY